MTSSSNRVAPRDVTTAICARDAARTIERAVKSALAQGGPVVLVDDWSNDETVTIARAVGGAVLLVVRPDEHRTLGYARRTAVDAVTTPWMQWLDADDELLPGRGLRLAALAAREGWDAVWDGAELCDGATGALVRELPMPPFMQRAGAAVRLFERNHTPGPAWPLVRTVFARTTGYDATLPTADDLDFMLRGLCAGGRFGFVAACGYRQYAYTTSLSRARAHQRQWVMAALKKHSYEDVRARYHAAGYDARIASWALVSMAAFREEWDQALGFLQELGPAQNAYDVLEPEGPWPFTEGWRRSFQRGTLLLLVGERDRQAVDALARAEDTEPTAEGANNLGVAFARTGRRKEAERCFALAEARFPGYADARANRTSSSPAAITVHPLRRLPSRNEYGE